MKKIFILAFAALFALAGCNKNADSPVIPSKGGPVRFATNLNSYTVKSSFAVNDQIGVFAGTPITRLNVLGTVVDNNGVAFAEGSEICWKEGQTAATTFAAYYPYNASCDATAADPFKFTFTLPADQSAGLVAADLLTAVAAGVEAPADPAAADPVSLSFTHRGAKFIVNVTKEISAAVTGVQILGTKLTGVVDMAAGTVSDLSGDDGTITAYRPDPSANTFEAVILPASIAPQIKVTVAGGTTYTYSMASPMAFEAGKQYTATVNIAAQTVSASAVGFTVGNIADWSAAGTNPVYPGDPVVVPGQSWGVIGLGDDWANDLPMTEVESFCWTITIDYTAEDEFKFRWANEWTYQFGMWASDPHPTITSEAIEATTADKKTYLLANGHDPDFNRNIVLPAAGNYTLKLYTGGPKEGELYVTKNN